MQNYWLSFSANHDAIQLDSRDKGKEKVRGVIADFASVEEHEVWKVPPSDYIKINVDASFVESINATSVGVVARNWRNYNVLVGFYW